MMTKEEAIAKAKKLNATRYKASRIKVKPAKFGKGWILVGVPTAK